MQIALYEVCFFDLVIYSIDTSCLSCYNLVKQKEKQRRCIALENQIGINISIYRKLRGLSQKDLGDRLSVSDKTISKWETGASLPDIYIIQKIAEILGCKIDDLLSGNNTATSQDNSSFPKHDTSTQSNENITQQQPFNISLINLMKSFWKNYFNFDGTVSRVDYWVTFLMNFILGCVPVLGLLYGLVSLIGRFNLIARRLNDAGKNKYLSLFFFLPFVGFIILIFFLCEPNALTVSEESQTATETALDDYKNDITFNQIKSSIKNKDFKLAKKLINSIKFDDTDAQVWWSRFLIKKTLTEENLPYKSHNYSNNNLYKHAISLADDEQASYWKSLINQAKTKAIFKRKKSLKIGAIIFSLCFVACVAVIIPVYETGNFPITYSKGGLYFVRSGENWEISHGDSNAESIIIPSEFKNRKVVGIKKSAFSGYNLRALTIPDSITYIGDYAFSNCRNLTSITLPDSVTNVSVGAFYGCISLSSVTLNENITEIGNSAFQSCSAITSISLPNNITRLGAKSFSGCSGLISILIPDNVTAIGAEAFSECTKLQSITFSSGLTSIGDRAFLECSSLTTATLQEGLLSIGKGAFDKCNSLTSISLPSTLTSIGERAFRDCTAITSITVPSNIQTIGSFAFGGCNKLRSLTFKNITRLYRTESVTDWQNKTNGISTSVTASEENAINFKNNYASCYWYN